MMQRILVWDLPIRVFHWALVLCFTGAYLSADSERYRDLHLALGYALLGLLVFRLIWGIWGSPYARFSAFPPSVRAGYGYLRTLGRHPSTQLGHNPAGALAIYALLGLALSISLSGLALYWEIGAEQWEDRWFTVHQQGTWFMLGLIALHVLGVLISSLLHRENLPLAMLSGYKYGAMPAVSTQPATGLGLALLLAIVGFIGLYWLF